MLEHCHPNIVIFYANRGEYQITDGAIPARKNIEIKVFEKNTKYSKLKIKLTKIWAILEPSTPIITSITLIYHKMTEIVS